MDSLISHGIAFLVGTATGAAGSYLADKFTDQRRLKEEERKASEQFADVAALMPDFIGEMRHDFAVPENATCREFFVVARGAILCCNSDVLLYEDDGINGYLNKVRILENHGYVVDITPSNAPMFRMNEHFVRALKNA